MYVAYLQVLAWCILLSMIGCTSYVSQQKQLRGRTMGTTYEIRYVDKYHPGLHSRIDSLLEVLNASLSTYIPESVISRVNRSDSDVEVSDEHFIRVFRAGQAVAAQTDGMFDMTVMPLVNAWGFGYREVDRLKIDSTRVDSLRQFVGYEKVAMSCDSAHRPPVCRILKKEPSVMLDFSSIAKGYGVDVLARFMEAQDIDRYMVEIGGEVRTKGRNAEDKWWRIGIEHPEEEDRAALMAVISLQHKALATSGNYRNFFVHEGVTYAHTINPHTGYPERNNLLSVTVIAADCMHADAYATAFMVSGYEQSREMLRNLPHLEALLVFSTGDGRVETYITPGMEQQVTVLEVR